MAPEQVLGCNELVGPGTNVYGLGAVLYATLTGYPPYQALASAELMRLIVSSAPERPSLRRRVAEPRSTGARRDLLPGARKDVADRYVLAEALALDLERYMAGDTVLAVVPSLVARRHKGAVALVVVAGAASWVEHPPGRGRTA